MNTTQQTLRDHFHEIESTWNDSIVPELIEYIKIPNQSPAFDPDWENNGYMDQAMAMIVAWCEQQPIHGMSLRVLREPGKTPLLYIEIPGQIENKTDAINAMTTTSEYGFTNFNILKKVFIFLF